MGIESLIGDSLRQKYALMQQEINIKDREATDRGLGLRAEANLNTVRAGLLPADSRAGIGLTHAQALAQAANARQSDEQTRYVGPLANANIYQSRASGDYLGRQGSEYGDTISGWGTNAATPDTTYRGRGAELAVHPAVAHAIGQAFHFGLGDTPKRRRLLDSGGLPATTPSIYESNQSDAMRFRYP